MLIYKAGLIFAWGSSSIGVGRLGDANGFSLSFEVRFKDKQGVDIELKSARRNSEFMSALQVRTNGEMGNFRQIMSFRDSWWEGMDNQVDLSKAAAKAFVHALIALVIERDSAIEMKQLTWYYQFETEANLKQIA